MKNYWKLILVTLAENAVVWGIAWIASLCGVDPEIALVAVAAGGLGLSVFPMLLCIRARQEAVPVLHGVGRFLAITAVIAMVYCLAVGVSMEWASILYLLTGAQGVLWCALTVAWIAASLLSIGLPLLIWHQLDQDMAKG